MSLSYYDKLDKKELTNKLIVIGVATEENSQCYNWKNSITKNGGEPHLLGSGEQWGGWGWRTRKYLDFLSKRNDDEIILITDVYDAYLMGNVDTVVNEFLNFDEKIIVSVERCYSLQGLQNIRDIKYDKYINLINKKFKNNKNDHISLNAGQMIGYCKDLKNLFQKTSKIMKEIINDDQAALFYILFDWLEEKIESLPFMLDFEQKIFGTIARDDSCQACLKSKITPLDYWNFDEKLKNYKSIQNNNNPHCFHFPGKAIEYYKQFAEKVHGNDFYYNIDCQEEKIKSSNSYWKLIFFIFLIILIIIVIILEYYIDIKN